MEIKTIIKVYGVIEVGIGVLAVAAGLVNIFAAK